MSSLAEGVSSLAGVKRVQERGPVGSGRAITLLCPGNVTPTSSPVLPATLASLIWPFLSLPGSLIPGMVSVPQEGPRERPELLAGHTLPRGRRAAPSGQYTFTQHPLAQCHFPSEARPAGPTSLCSQSPQSTKSVLLWDPGSFQQA